MARVGRRFCDYNDDTILRRIKLILRKNLKMYLALWFKKYGKFSQKVIERNSKESRM